MGQGRFRQVLVVTMTLVSVLVASRPVFAAIELIDVRRVSGKVLVPIQGEQVTIYGGTAGVCEDQNPTALCNSCEGDRGLTACNTQRIFDDLLVQFEFRSNSLAGFPILRTNNAEEVPARNTLIIQPIGATQILEVRWGDICRLIPQRRTNVPASCENAEGQVQLNLGVTAERNQVTGGDVRTVIFRVGGPATGQFNTNEGCDTDDPNADEGICAFTAFPGDGKVFITDLLSGNGFPQVSGLEAQFLRVFVSEEGFIQSPSESLEPENLRISTTEDLGLEKRDVGGLENGKRYFFRVATVDIAGNVANFTGDEEIVRACESLTDPSPTCPYAARPDEVLGLLTDDFNCFIASATLGNPLAPQIDILRRFRSQVLRPTVYGKKLINWYYKAGPYAARWIADRAWARFFLTPVIWLATLFAWASLQVGLWPTALVSSIGFTLLGWLFIGRLLAAAAMKMSRK